MHRLPQPWLRTGRTHKLVILLAVLSVISSQGTAKDGASESGLSLEDEISETLTVHCVPQQPASEWDEASLYLAPDMVLAVTNAPYQSIYGHRSRIEFLLLHHGEQTFIEAKRQMTSGSTDEKLPYVVENAKAAIGEGRGFLLVMDGEGFKPGAKSWVKAQGEALEGFDVIAKDGLAGWLNIQGLSCQAEPVPPAAAVDKGEGG